MKKLLPFIIFFLFSARLFAQDAVADSLQHIADSLHSVIKTAKHDTTRLSALTMLVEITDDQKVWPAYNLQVKNLAKKNLRMKPGEQLEKRYKYYLSNAYHNMGFLASGKGEIDKALAYY